MLTSTSPPVTVSRSKIERPLISGQWVRRPRLEARLDRGLERSLVVISAPAGHGKTSSLVSWLLLRNLDAAWVSIDSRDADLTRFASHLAISLDNLVPGMATPLIALLTVPDRLQPAELGEAFGEALYDLDRDVVLVLDDFHAARSDTVSAFVVGMLHTAPRRLHTVISARGRPPFSLSRFRTAGDVEELTGADFRFSPQETSELLRLETGEDVAPDVATSLQASVGGWPAAIKLFAISGGPSGAIAPGAVGELQTQLLFDYLGDEVLARLPTAQRELLLRAALVDRFNASLLEALSADLDGEQIDRANLDDLRALDLFREVPGLTETWFVYHPLFRDILHRELQRKADAQTITDLHRRIARWFAAAGKTQEAVQHFVATDDMAAAAALIESRVAEAFAREDWQSVASWLRLVPERESRERPELLLASAWVAYLSGRSARIADVLTAMRQPRFRDKVTASQSAEISLLADWPDDDLAAAVTLVENAIAHIPARKRYRAGYAQVALGMALTSVGREEEALANLAAYAERESSRIDAASIRGYFGRTVVLWQVGRLARCEQAAADQLQLAQLNNLPISAGWGAAFLGMVAYERGDLDQATRHFEMIFAAVDQFHFLCVRDVFFAQILAYLAQGMYDEADRAVARLRELVIVTENLHQLEVVDSFLARTALVRGDVVTAQRWLETSSPSLRADDLKSIEHPLLTRAKVLITLGTEITLAEAERLLTRYVQTAREEHMALALIESLAVMALLHEARDERAAATRALRESLTLAAPEGIVQRYAYLGAALAPMLRRLAIEPSPIHHARTVLDALETILAAHPERPGPTHHAPRELAHGQLSARELEVLRCLARRLTNDEIGDELFISPITVKHHVANISGKLAVSGRRAAVARAGELGLLA